MRLRSVLLNIVNIFSLCVMVIALSASAVSSEAAQPSDIPAWLRTHVGEREGQIARVVLRRARALYLQKVREGVVRNPCYFAMDATRPSDLGDSKLGRRFYLVCESNRSFRAISAGHGGGRDLKGVADFANGRRCAKNFGNAMDSKLTAGGAYVTGETKTSFKGYYRVSPKQDAVLMRSFIQFDGEGETANARQREIGGHAAELLKNVCLRKDSHSPYANQDGYVPFGKLVDYAGGRSDGCTSWSPSDAGQIIAMVKDNPTTLYIYPQAADIDAVAQAVKAGRSPSRAGLYWNASCLKEIGAPKFWPKETLAPILAQYKKDHPASPQATRTQQARAPLNETLVPPLEKVSTPPAAKACVGGISTSGTKHQLHHISLNECRRLGVKQTNSVTIDPPTSLICRGFPSVNRKMRHPSVTELGRGTSELLRQRQVERALLVAFASAH